uniref:Uncharacterized protein n=1 Tax=Arundo donax TaxID=35708 RepID=A0A0A9HA95_ARUDO
MESLPQIKTTARMVIGFQIYIYMLKPKTMQKPIPNKLRENSCLIFSIQT